MISSVAKLRDNLRPVDENDSQSYVRDDTRRRVESLTIRETRWVWRAPDEADSRLRMVDTGAYLRAKRRGW